MSGVTKLLPVAALLLLGAIGPVEAQHPPTEPAPDLAKEVAGVNRSLAKVALMLEQFLEQQKTDIVLKRIEMRERRIAPLEAELLRRKGELEASQAEIDRLESLKENWDDRLREEARTNENVAEELRRMQAEFEQASAGQTTRHQALQETVRRLEDELEEGREAIQDLEALLLERIGE